jgi:hypothetical protein
MGSEPLIPQSLSNLVRGCPSREHLWAGGTVRIVLDDLGCYYNCYYIWPAKPRLRPRGVGVSRSGWEQRRRGEAASLGESLKKQNHRMTIVRIQEKI